MTDNDCIPRQPRSRMASAQEIHLYWARDEHEAWWKWFKQCDLGEPSCYACGYYSTMAGYPEDLDKDDSAAVLAAEFAGLERSHLVDHAKGGSGWPSNLVLLCRPCNRRMPSFRQGQRDMAISWVRSQPTWHEEGMARLAGVRRYCDQTGELPAWLRLPGEAYLNDADGWERAFLAAISRQPDASGEVRP